MLEIKYIPLGTVMSWQWGDNPKIHDLEGIKASIRRHGFRDPPEYDPSLEGIPTGNGRAEALSQMRKAGEPAPKYVQTLEGGDWAIPVLFGADAGSRAACEAYAVDHNNLTVSGIFSPEKAAELWETDKYTAILQDLDAQEQAPTSVDDDGYMAIIQQANNPPGGGQEEDADQDQELPEEGPVADVPDAIFPSDNAWGIPSLLPKLQAQRVHMPAIRWGAVRRTKKTQGTWLFYTDDYRFEALWRDPMPVVQTGCQAVIEPNFTVGTQSPRALALWQIYRKRWLARWWQSCGIQIIVDVNIDMDLFGDIAFLGVPEGWGSYATHGYGDRLWQAQQEFEASCAHAGRDDILFILYGGGKSCQTMAQDNNWLYIPEHMDMKQNGVLT